jgi:hypothetical protein
MALPWAIRAQGKIDESVVWLIDVFTATLVVSVAMLKEYFFATAEEISRRDEPIRHAGSSIVGALARIDGERYKHALMIVRETCRDLDDIEQGILPLKPRDYYDRIEHAIRTAPPKSKVWAVGSADPFQWQADKFQRHWLELNKEAVLKRSLDIHRVFIFDPVLLDSAEGNRIRDIIKEQIDTKIKVTLVDPNAIAHLGPEIKDAFVLFHGTRCLFRDYPDEGYPGRVLKGELVLNPDLINRSKINFEILQSNRVKKSALGNDAGA